MNYAICLNTIIPVRSKDNHRSEMVTQLLFGDTCIITDEVSDFVSIINTFDSYKGWVEKKMLNPITENEYHKLNKAPLFLIKKPFADVLCLSDNTIIHLTIGSRLPFFDPDKNSFNIGEKKYLIPSNTVISAQKKNKAGIIPSSKILLNTPYLWGGRNILGMDCSAFVQLVFLLNGYKLPRNARQQAKLGEKILSLEKAEATDILFFGENGRITHSGIYLGNGKIIHCSGYVKINDINDIGIVSEYGEISHKVCLVKRLY